MKSILVGLLFLALGVYSVLPFGWALNWGAEVLAVLRGAGPLLVMVLGLLSLLIGLADLKDKAKAKSKAKAQEGTKS